MRKESRTLTGAWIETEDKIKLLETATGRTLTGAWIETGVRIMF